MRVPYEMISFIVVLLQCTRWKYNFAKVHLIPQILCVTHHDVILCEGIILFFHDPRRVLTGSNKGKFKHKHPTSNAVVIYNVVILLKHIIHQNMQYQLLLHVCKYICVCTYGLCLWCRCVSVYMCVCLKYGFGFIYKYSWALFHNIIKLL